MAAVYLYFSCFCAVVSVLIDRHRQINHARNVWDRAVTILPRANQFWYKYTYMEEMLGNVAGLRVSVCYMLPSKSILVAVKLTTLKISFCTLSNKGPVRILQH